MKQGTPRTLVLASIVAGVLPLAAADDVGIKLEAPAAPNKNRFGVGYRAGFHINARFNNVGNIRAGGGNGAGPATGGNVDRNYDDGYVRRDSNNNQDGFTWNWGYRDASQITGPDTVEFHSTSASPIKSGRHDSDPQHGIEFTYNRELGRAESGKWSWGFESGFGYTDIDMRDTRALSGGVTVIADTYTHTGIDPTHNQIPPGSSTPPPYDDNGTILNPGTFNGPGPLLGSEPSREITSDASGSLVTGKREFNADFFTFRLGPYLDLPINEKWFVSLSAGVAVGVMDGEYHINQRVTTAGGTLRQRATGSDTDVLYGGYLSGTVHYRIDECWGLFAGLQYLGFADCYKAEAAGQEIELDLQSTAFFTTGVTFSF